MSLKSKFQLVFIVFSLLLVACGPKVVYDSRVEINTTAWHKDSVAVFRSDVSDLQTSYHLLLQTGVSSDFAYNNIWFFVDAVSPSGHVQRDTIDCYLSASDGGMYGDKSWFRDNYATVQPYKLNIRFPEKGLYKYYVSQGMRDTVITGVNSIGVKIIEVK